VATPEASPALQALTIASVTPAPIVQISSSTVTPAASPSKSTGSISQAILLISGTSDDEGTDSVQPETEDHPAANSPESGGWKTFGQ